MKLSNQQIGSYRQEGYLVYGNLLTETEIRELSAAYREVLEALHNQEKLTPIRKGTLDDGRATAVYQIRVAHLHHPKFNDLLRHSRLLDAVESLIGPEIRLVLFQGLYKPPLTGGVIGWHQDDYYFRVSKPNAVVSCWLALDDATLTNGCMWMLPRAHHALLDHVPAEGAGYEIRGIEETRAVPVELKAGECLFHHGATPHRTLANTSHSHRRALALHFMDATAVPLGNGRQEEPPEHTPVLRSRVACSQPAFLHAGQE